VSDTTPTLDVVALGHPLVDVLSHEADDVVARTKVERGAMTMVDAARSDEIYGQMTYDGVAQTLHWDNVELRFANTGTVFSKPVSFGS